MMLLIRFMARFTIHFPVPKATLDSWAKTLDDVVKAALLGIPAMLWLDNHASWSRFFALLGLLLVVYLGTWLANFLRTKENEWTIPEETNDA